MLISRSWIVFNVVLLYLQNTSILIIWKFIFIMIFIWHTWSFSREQKIADHLSWENSLGEQKQDTLVQSLTGLNDVTTLLASYLSIFTYFRTFDLKSGVKIRLDLKETSKYVLIWLFGFFFNLRKYLTKGNESNDKACNVWNITSIQIVKKMSK